MDLEIGRREPEIDAVAAAHVVRPITANGPA
jgi:hypothetical protein